MSWLFIPKMRRTLSGFLDGWSTEIEIKTASKKAAAGTPSRGEHRHVMFCIREINHVLVVFDFSPG
ncbi:hypothetical protein, partial [Salinibacter ruber]|uniref:hypothetical protein n=1 Tax=Salinibacter ruber TaxID=146919 RepID=UPI001C848B17